MVYLVTRGWETDYMAPCHLLINSGLCQSYLKCYHLHEYDLIQISIKCNVSDLRLTCLNSCWLP